MSEQELEPIEGAEVAAPEPSPEELAERQELEATAQKYGWKPKEEYVGDEGNWRPAEDFLSIPKVQVRLLKDTIKANEKAAKDREKSFKEQFSSVEKTIQQVATSARKQEAEKWQERLAEVQRQKREAASTGDLETYDRLQGVEARIQGQAPVAPHWGNESPPTPNLPDWAHDPELRQVGAAILDATPGALAMAPERQFKLAEDRLRAMYPEKFPAPQQTPKAPAVNRVEGGGLAGGIRPKGPTFDGLPSEAREAFGRFVEMGVYKNTDEGRSRYLKAYHGEE